MTPPPPTVRRDEVSWIDTAQMREIDRIMIEELHIELLQMMENAGRALADLASRESPRSVLVAAGAGGNGGGGLVAARHLANAGAAVHVVLGADPAGFSAAAAHQLDIARRMGMAVTDRPADAAPAIDADLAIDALVGYGLAGDLRPTARAVLDQVRRTGATVISLDAPSGLDTTTGELSPGAVSPDATVTLCLPKRGLADRDVGELYLADISVPPFVVERVAGGGAPPFHRGRLLHVVDR